MDFLLYPKLNSISSINNKTPEEGKCCNESGRPNHPEWLFQWHDLDILAFSVGFVLLDFCLGIIVVQRSMSTTSLMVCCRMVGFEVLFSKFIGLALLEIFPQADHFLFWLTVLMGSLILIYMLAVISRFTVSEAQGYNSHP